MLSAICIGPLTGDVLERVIHRPDSIGDCGSCLCCSGGTSQVHSLWPLHEFQQHPDAETLMAPESAVMCK